MLMNNDPAPLDPSQNITNNIPQAQTPSPMPADQPAPPVTPPDASHSRKKLYISIFLVLVLVAAAVVYFLVIKKSPAAPVAVQKKANSTLASAKKQYYLNDSVSGYINYKPDSFKEITDTRIPKIAVPDPNVNSIIVTANLVSFKDSGLYLYDIKANKTYKLTDGGGSPRIMSDHYLLYGFDTGSGSSKQLGGKLLDLQTGQTQTVFSGAPEDVPGTVCCSVSPDGFKAAFVQKDKISIWDIRTGKTTDVKATVAPIDPNFSRNSGNDYNTEISYATPQWLDNDNLIYTDKPAASLVEANKPKQILDNTLYELNINSATSSEIKTNKSGIYDIYIAAGSTFVNEVPVDSTQSQISLVLLDGSAPKVIGANPGFAMISPSALSAYLFATLDSPNAYNSADTQTAIPKYASFDPHISGVKVSQILPRGWIDGERMILAELDTAGTQNHEYIAVYNVTTNKVEQSLQIN
jgi:hypothetical protein